METEKTPTSLSIRSRRYPMVAGIFLVAIGVAALLGQYVAIRWLPLLMIPIAGLVLLVEGYSSRRFGFLLAGSLIFSAGAGGFVAFGNRFQLGLIEQVGLFLLFFSLGWVAVYFVSRNYPVYPAWWAFIPAALLASVGACLYLGRLRVVDFALAVATSLGLALLAWGMARRLLGLIIPGSLMVGLGPGIYLAWGHPAESNSLAQTGVMLVGFALGWAVISIVSRISLEKFIWWPLIPGAVLAVVGWGLYIGGNPANAANFIANTGSIGLIIFGIYLLLMRRGIHH